MRFLILVAAAAATLASCGSEKGGDLPPAETMIEGRLGAPEPKSPVSIAATMPQTFLGRWGLVPADCDPSRADNKGLMTIEPELLRFYESRARVGPVVVSSPTRITADLSFSGEGQTWGSKTIFELHDGGTRLTRSDAGEGAPLDYARCPA